MGLSWASVLGAAGMWTKWCQKALGWIRVSAVLEVANKCLQTGALGFLRAVWSTIITFGVQLIDDELESTNRPRQACCPVFAHMVQTQLPVADEVPVCLGCHLASLNYLYGLLFVFCRLHVLVFMFTAVWSTFFLLPGGKKHFLSLNSY